MLRVIWGTRCLRLDWQKKAAGERRPVFDATNCLDY
jgi:hypothetical protein